MNVTTFFTPKRMLRGLAITAAASLLAISLPMTASATAPGSAGDVSKAMIYGETGPIGAVIPQLRNQDDTSFTIAAPFPINFFGTKYDALCVSTNGTVSPVLTIDTGCSSAYNRNLADLALDNQAPVIAALAADIDLSNRVTSEGSAVVNDGFGEPGNIYYGPTTVDGADAAVLTWYRVLMYNNANSTALSNTFQIVLTKTPTTNGDTVGYDFTIQFNYGLIQDAEEGYTAAACTEASELCVEPGCVEDCARWGIGWANYLPNAVEGEPGTADPYELFATTPMTALIDGAATSLTANSLNSSVPGRYTFSMVGGVTQEFVVPTMDGIPSGAVPPVFTLDAVEPVPAPALGQITSAENGVAVASTVARDAAGTGVTVTGADFSVSLAGLAPDDSALPVDANGIVTLQSDAKARVSGAGFAPNSELRVYLFSTPVLLGTLTTNAAGAFSATFPMPAGVAVGNHTVQVRGFTTGGAVRELNLGVRVIGPQLASTGVDAGIVLGSSLALLVLGAGATLVARRRLAL
ncbi:hypothetical protein E3O06_07205 [Cryobacterium glaciale]|uniref:NIDO domain-containing protein n=1 Tax=Cryobacterium glaciale TaxID=1259145 RepID=A0A4R8UYK2_9MICO|nr:nidogen-like domain-containing protein [Cryobacterium glaciale]TFB74185.1 hypothetical protein E3O06_07205 [Cryobacterium glaciale]